jgi:hypothetical protein
MVFSEEKHTIPTLAYMTGFFNFFGEVEGRKRTGQTKDFEKLKKF